MESQKNVVTEPAVAAGTGQNATPDVSGSAAGTQTAEAEQQQEKKTYDQKYVDQLMADQKAALEAAVEEAKKVAKMDDQKKEEYEKEKTQKLLDQREKEVAARELKADARELLKEKEVPVEFLDMVLGSNMKETEANVDAFKKQFDAAVQAQVEKRLAGKTPATGSGASSETSAMEAEIEKYLN